MSRTEEFISTLRQKPAHVRHRIAVGTSVGITALVAVIWITAMASSGTFALKTGTPKEGNGQAPSTDAFALSGTNVKSNFSELAGAVGAAMGATSSQPALTVIDGTTTSSFDHPAAPSANANPSATVIPF